MDLIGVGAQAPIVLGLGAGLASQVRATSGGATAADVSSITTTGVGGFAASSIIGAVIRESKKTLKKQKSYY